MTLVHDLQEANLLGGAVGHAAPRALLALLALLDHLFDQCFPQEVIRGAAAQLLNEPTADILRQQDATALLADALQDLQDLLEVACVEHRQAQLHDPEVASTSLELLAARLARPVLVGRTQSQV